MQLLAVLALVGALSAVSALPTCGPTPVKFNKDKIVIVAVGDWGRAAAQNSQFSPATVQLCNATRECCSTEQNNNFPSDFDSTDADDGPQQILAAALMNEVCGKVGCDAAISLGDNFYPCGADDPTTSGLNRFESDWKNVYQVQPNLKHLNWYQIVGNHDYGFDGSVERQVNYSKVDKQWKFPQRYYATKFEGNGFSLQLHSLDATPFVGAYVYPHPNYAYFHKDFAAHATPDYINTDAAAEYFNKTTGLCTIPPANASIITEMSNDATGQVPWLKSCLETSTATWNAVTGHFALWGSDQEYGNSKTHKYYPGNCGAWGSIQSLVDKYKPAFYINGHDHTMTHADPLHAGTSSGATLGTGAQKYTLKAGAPTQYFTLGNGASLAYGDGVTPGQPKSYNDFSAVIYNNNFEGSPGEGFATITITKCNMTVDYWSYINYKKMTSPVHTVFIPRKC